MMRFNKYSPKKGFTLIEAVVTTFIMVLVIATAISGYLFMERSNAQQLVETQIDTEMDLATARLNHELRLTSLTEAVYYPEGGPRYTAISFPLRRSTNYVFNAEGSLPWDTTVIYHFKKDDREETGQLIRTEISPRETLTLEKRKEQLAAIAENGNWNNATTRVLLENITEWEIFKEGNSYDAYAEFDQLDEEETLGTFLVDPGENTLKLKITGKNSKSTGYKVGLDTLLLSASGYPREAEQQQASGTPSPLLETVTAGTWSGYRQLTFPANSADQEMEVVFYNDRFEDTNFDLPMASHSNTTVGVLDHSFSPPDLALRLKGNTTNWTAKGQIFTDAENYNDVFTLPGSPVRCWDDLGGSVFRVILTDIGTEYSGAGCRIAFSASALGDLSISGAVIDEAVPPVSSLMHTAGSPKILTFNNFGSITIPAGETVFSDFADFPIEIGKYYAVTFRIDRTRNRPKLMLGDPARTNSFFISQTELPGTDHSPLTIQQWAGSGYTVFAVPFIAAVELMHTTYPKTGTYISPPINTAENKPAFEKIEWTEYVPNGTGIKVFARTSDRADMPSSSWKQITGSGGEKKTKVNPPLLFERYLQYKVELTSGDKGINTPKLRDIAFQWPGETRPVDIGGNLVKGPDYGQFTAELNGQPIPAPIRINIETKADLFFFGANRKEFKRKSSIRITPRN